MQIPQEAKEEPWLPDPDSLVKTPKELNGLKFWISGFTLYNFIQMLKEINRNLFTAIV